MESVKRGINWRIGFAAFAVIYVAWVSYLSLDNFDMVHTAYRDARARLEPARVEEIARRELVDRCRRQHKQQGPDETISADEASCRSFPATVVEQQRDRVAKRLGVEKNRFKRKVVVFYVSFVLVFLALPLVFIYGLISFILWILRNIKIIQ